MSQKTGPVLALLAIVPLAGLASFVATKFALPPASEPALLPGPGALADVQARLDEFERRLGYVDQRLEAAEATARRALDLAEGLRDRRPLVAAPGTAPAAGGPETPAKTPAAQGPTAPAAPLDPAQMTDDQLREARIRQIQDAIRTTMRTEVPARLMELASTAPEVAERRRVNARVEARQMAIVLACTGDEADKLQEVYLEHIDRQVREIGPLVRDGVERADLSAVETRLSESWTEMDRRVREVLGEAKFRKFSESADPVRALSREALAALRK